MTDKNNTIDDMLAAEYVLGTLQGLARRRFERLLQKRHDLVILVENWNAILNQLAPLAPPVEPPPEAWQKIVRRIDDEQRSKQLPHWGGVRFWRATALSCGLLTLALCAFLLLPGFIAESTYLILINNTKEQPVWLIDAPSPIAELQVRNISPLAIPSSKRCVLWLQPEGSADYYPIGILPDDGGRAVIPIRSNLRSMLPGRLVVSLEDTVPHIILMPIRIR